MAAGLTYTPIATYTVSGSSSATYTINSIPSTYTDLILIVNARSARNDTVNDVSMRVNGDSSSLYSFTRLFGDGTTAYSDKGSNQTYITTIGGTAGANATSGIFSTHTVHFNNYANTNIYKSIIVRGSYAPGGGNGFATTEEVALYRSTNVISSITIFMLGNFNIADGTNFTLYGITAA